MSLEFGVCEPLVHVRGRCFACGAPGGHCPTCCAHCIRQRDRWGVDLDPVTLERRVRRRLIGKQTVPPDGVELACC